MWVPKKICSRFRTSRLSEQHSHQHVSPSHMESSAVHILLAMKCKQTLSCFDRSLQKCFCWVIKDTRSQFWSRVSSWVWTRSWTGRVRRARENKGEKGSDSLPPSDHPEAWSRWLQRKKQLPTQTEASSGGGAGMWRWSIKIGFKKNSRCTFLLTLPNVFMVLVSGTLSRPT